jgi:hypothetical protein
VEASSARNGIGLVKLMGRQSGFIAVQASMASGGCSFFWGGGGGGVLGLFDGSVGLVAGWWLVAGWLLAGLLVG